MILFNRCAVELARGTPPDPFPIERTFAVSLTDMNLMPPVEITAPAQRFAVQLARPSSILELALIVENTSPLLEADVRVELVLPFTLVVANPPFVPPVDPAATYDPSTRKIAWTGGLDPAEAVSIRFQGTFFTGTCRTDLTAQILRGDCLEAAPRLIVPAVPDLTPGPFVVGFGANSTFGTSGIEDNVLFFRPDVDTQFGTLLCLPTEFATGMGVAPDGDIYVTKLPSYRFNPETLEIAPIDTTALGVSSVEGITFNPSDGSVLFYGSNFVGGQSRAGVSRYDPGTGQVTPLLDDPSLGLIRKAHVDPDGLLVALSAFQGLVRVDLGDPGNVQSYPIPGLLSPGTLAVDLDGNYLVTGQQFTVPRPLLKVDRNTGVVETVVPDLAGADLFRLR